MQQFVTGVIGGGASGIAAAIRAKRHGAVVLCEKMPRLGKKILASGNGRCNLSNERLDPASYNAASRHLVKSVFASFGKEAIDGFFARLGVMTYDDDCRLFPVTNQSATVLRALERELTRGPVTIKHGFDVRHLTADKTGFVIAARSGERLRADRVVLATGGRTYPSFGSDGSGYALAKQFGHTIIEPVPVAVPLEIKDPLCHLLQGQKIFARVRALIGGAVAAESNGELLFTKYGLSGTAILDISRPLSIAIHRHKAKDVQIAVDLVPFMERSALLEELRRRVAEKFPADDMLVGLLPNKFGPALGTRADAAGLKDMRFTVTGTRGWNEADFTAGGVDTREVREGTLESKVRPGLFFCGEVLDVDGERGGFNLAWAWASGMVAGAAGRHT